MLLAAIGLIIANGKMSKSPMFIHSIIFHTEVCKHLYLYSC